MHGSYIFPKQSLEVASSNYTNIRPYTKVKECIMNLPSEFMSDDAGPEFEAPADCMGGGSMGAYSR